MPKTLSNSSADICLTLSFSMTDPTLAPGRRSSSWNLLDDIRAFATTLISSGVPLSFVFTVRPMSHAPREAKNSFPVKLKSAPSFTSSFFPMDCLRTVTMASDESARPAAGDQGSHLSHPSATG